MNWKEIGLTILTLGLRVVYRKILSKVDKD